MPETLTAKQAELLSFIKQKIASENIAPSFEEMREAMGVSSKSVVHRLMNGLIERGHIRRTKQGARRMEVLS